MACVPNSSGKLRASLELALRKRPVSIEAVDARHNEREGHKMSRALLARMTIMGSKACLPEMAFSTTLVNSFACYQMERCSQMRSERPL